MSRYPFHVDGRDVAIEGTELEIQAGFRNKMRHKAPEVMLVAVPNAGRRTSYEALTRHREGMVSGFPDLIALWDGKVAFLEFKNRTGQISDSQIACLNRLVRHNFAVGVFRSPDTAVDWLRKQGAPFL